MGCTDSKEKKQQPQDDDDFTDLNNQPEQSPERDDTVKASNADGRHDPVDAERPNKVDSIYKNGGPKAEGEAFPCFKAGLLYRIVNGDTWHFYNDTTEYEMHITWRFGPESTVEPLGETKMDRDEKNWIVMSLVVYPAETKEFMTGSYNGYKSAFSAKPLSPEYREKIMRDAELRVRGELDAVVQLAHGRKDDEAILASCVLQQVPYVDLDFKPHQKSLSRPEDKRQLHPVAWMRPKQYLPANEAERVCLIDEIDPNDIDQGQLGDCWFLCSVASLAEFPSKIEDIFRHPSSLETSLAERSVGAYRVTLNKHGWWQVFIVDDYLPCVGGQPCFAKNAEDHAELWVALLEKAYAKAHGSYASITGGDALHALQDLSGYPTSRFDTMWEEACKDEAASVRLFDDIERYDKEKYLININTPGVDNSAYMGNHSAANGREFEERYKAAGLGMGHAYSVLQAKSFPNERVRLLQIRNPWGNGTEWSGDWGDDSPLWQKHPRIANECDFKKAEDGTFWMEWEDVKKYFDGGGVCFTKFDWFDYRVRGAFDDGYPNTILEITCTEACDAFIILSQKDRRGQPRGSPDAKYAAAMLSVCAPDVQKGRHRVHMNSTSDADKPSEQFTFMFSRDLSMKYHFEPSERPYLVVPRIYDAGASKDYVLGLISSIGVGANFKVSFKRLSSDSPVFKNYMAFPYEADDTPLVKRQHQFNPEVGTPLTGTGNEFMAA